MTYPIGTKNEMKVKDRRQTRGRRQYGWLLIVGSLIWLPLIVFDTTSVHGLMYWYRLAVGLGFSALASAAGAKLVWGQARDRAPVQSELNTNGFAPRSAVKMWSVEDHSRKVTGKDARTDAFRRGVDPDFIPRRQKKRRPRDGRDLLSGPKR